MKERFGLSSEQIQTDVELQLRKAGIRVGDGDSSSFLYVYVNATEAEGGYAATLEIAFNQIVRLERASTVRLVVPTWGIYPVLLTASKARYVEFTRQWIRDLADRFANAYLSVNQK